MVTALIVILSLVALLWLWLAVSPVHRVTFRELLQATTPIPAGGDDPLPVVTLIAPARNEAPVLPKAVPSYCRQDYPNLHVIVVDDQSEDDSAAVLDRLSAEHPNLTVVKGEPRPDGWLGKPWAVAQGVKKAFSIFDLRFLNEEALPASSGTADPQSKNEHQKSKIPDHFLCFTDADCIFHPAAVRTAVAFMRERNLDMLSLIPRAEFGQACEAVGMSGLVTVLTMMFPTGSVNNPASPIALAAGGFILIRRSAYEKVGGHEAVKNHINEDVNMARKAKASGCRINLRLTPDLVTTRMYEGWDDLWEGLSKNAYAGMDYQPRKFWVGLVVGLLVAVLPPVYLLGTLWWALASSRPVAWVAFGLAALINLCMAVIHARTVRFLRLPFYHTILMPFSSGLYVLIAISSAFQHHYRGGNLWKGRRYDRATLLKGIGEGAGST